MNALFHTVPLPPASLLPLLGLASVVLWAEEARKLGCARSAVGRP
jgi:Ca2+-transporting ATPase